MRKQMVTTMYNNNDNTDNNDNNDNNDKQW